MFGPWVTVSHDQSMAQTLSPFMAFFKLIIGLAIFTAVISVITVMPIKVIISAKDSAMLLMDYSPYQNDKSRQGRG